MKGKTANEELLDSCLKAELEQRIYHPNVEKDITSGSMSDSFNIMFFAKKDDDVLSFVKQWAEKNDIRLFVLDWNKLDRRYINDYTNGLLKDISEPKTVIYLDKYNCIEFDKRYLVFNVLKNRSVGSFFCAPAPNFWFAIATFVIDDPGNRKERMNLSERYCFDRENFLTEDEG